MTMNYGNPFAGMAQAQISEAGSSNYPKPGFDGEVKPTRMQIKIAGEAGLSFIADCEVVASNHEAHPVGQSVTFFQKMSVRPALAAVKEFLTACVGLDPHDPNQVAQLAARPHDATPHDPPTYSWYDRMIEQIGGCPHKGWAPNEVSNMAIGKVVHCVAYEKLLKDKSSYITVCKWGPSTGRIGAPSNQLPTARQLPAYQQQLPIAVVQPPAFGNAPQAPAQQGQWGGIQYGLPFNGQSPPSQPYDPMNIGSTQAPAQPQQQQTPWGQPATVVPYTPPNMGGWVPPGQGR